MPLKKASKLVLSIPEWNKGEKGTGFFVLTSCNRLMEGGELCLMKFQVLFFNGTYVNGENVLGAGTMATEHTQQPEKS